jgi:hypothetical protein
MEGPRVDVRKGTKVARRVVLAIGVMDGSNVGVLMSIRGKVGVACEFNN